MLLRKLLPLIVLFLSCCLVISTTSSEATRGAMVKSTGDISYDVFDDIYRLRASGTKIVDGLGNEVILKGAQIDYSARNTGYFSPEDVQKLKSYGGNCLEIHLIRFQDMMPERDRINENYFVDKLDKWVSWCEENQIYVIIDLRQFRWTSYCAMPEWMLIGHDYGNPPYDEETTNQAFKDFLNVYDPTHDDNRESFKYLWKFIAGRYINNQFVSFSMMNEPLCRVSLTADEATRLGETYSRFMEQVVDAIRSVGGNQLIFINRPYVTGVPQYFQNIQPVNRDNIVWEDHLYVNPSTDLEKWKAYIDLYVKRYINDFGKPLFIGEFGLDPYDIVEEEPWKSNWKSILTEQVAYLKGSPICGRQWHHWGALEGEYQDRVFDWFTAEDSDYILETIFG